MNTSKPVPTPTAYPYPAYYTPDPSISLLTYGYTAFAVVLICGILCSCFICIRDRIRKRLHGNDTQMVPHDFFTEEPLPKYSLGDGGAVLSGEDTTTNAGTAISSDGEIMSRDLEEAVRFELIVHEPTSQLPLHLTDPDLEAASGLPVYNTNSVARWRKLLPGPATELSTPIKRTANNPAKYPYIRCAAFVLLAHEEAKNIIIFKRCEQAFSMFESMFPLSWMRTPGPSRNPLSTPRS
ncbi:hypothetical protein HDU98_001647 [Podochytrium sp. JEL0797]|nr:hypothetical protein HDU98_001647 [Podochytrium sp. JEL0797]